MKIIGFSAVLALACVQGIFLLAGCGGGSSAASTTRGTTGGGGGTQQPPSIASFSAGAATIEATTGTTLTASFSNGTGMITGSDGFGQSLTSGSTVSVTPAVTTTYTLTVTGASSTTPATQTTTVTVDPVPTITSFSAGASAIQVGSSTTLTATFAGATSGTINPGNLAIASGGSVTVNPATTTKYTLTVNPPVGTIGATSLPVTVTVYPVPVITSFTASQSTIAAPGSTQLTAVFSGGTGVVAPGNITMTSGTAVTVTPTSTTTYTLTVVPGVGPSITQTTTVTVNTGVTVNQGTFGAAVSNQLLGMNLAAWYDVAANANPINTAFGQAGIKAIRWPGGSWSDVYHWGEGGAAPAMCPGGNGGSTWAGSDTFAQFMTSIAKAGQYDLALTANYGSNAACTAGGDPTEAAAWAAQAVTDGYPASHITVGNEEYGSWEYDLHTNQHNPTTYASAVSGSSGYYSDIKSAVENAGGSASTTQVGVIVDANCTTSNGCTNGWDSTVLAAAKGYYDFVEYHYYPQYGNITGDNYLVDQAAIDFTTNINKIKSELATAGEPNMPIYVGEIGANSSDPGTQSWSITQGLYAGQILGEAMNDGVSRMTWWIGLGNCLGAGNNGASLYGWQNTWGSYDVFSDADTNCPGAGPIGTMSPTAQAFNLFQNVAVSGEHVLGTTIAGDTTDVRAYAATHSGGTALVLFNLNETTPETVVVSLSGQTNSSVVTVTTYDKQMYDYTNVNCQVDPSCTYDSTHNYSTAQWVSPTTTTLSGSQTFPLTVTLQPWSMNVVTVK